MEDQSAGQIQLGRARSDALRKLVDRGAAEPVGKGGQLGMLAQLWQCEYAAGEVRNELAQWRAERQQRWQARQACQFRIQRGVRVDREKQSGHALVTVRVSLQPRISTFLIRPSTAKCLPGRPQAQSSSP